MPTNAGEPLNLKVIEPSSLNATAPRLQVNPARVSTFAECLIPPESVQSRFFIKSKAIVGILRRARNRKRSVAVLQRTRNGTIREITMFPKTEGDSEFWSLLSENGSRDYPTDGLLCYLTGKGPKHAGTP